jgi:hypothetical protein
MFRTPYSTWDPKWSETEHEIFRDFGYAAFAAQMLEAALIHVLLAAEHAGHIKLEKSAGMDSDLFLSKKTLGCLVKELKRAGMNNNLEDLLRDALDARNLLMHGFFDRHCQDFLTEVGRGRMLKELQRLRFRIGRVQHVLSQIREQVYEKIFGITKSDARRLYEKYRKQKSAT